ncbi:MAG: UDP-N-acetylglucosamine 2-epimerase (hydrolyzing) [Clostridia bacterium]|nr:UDP-N-acetylglucosamine 2-epimerase (hydrolyzing) [Clostridia bacterium]
MKNIAVVTSNRAEYGILIPLIKKIYADDDLHLMLIVTGAHLSEKYGYTIEQIKDDGFPIAAAIPILEEGNTVLDVSLSMANAIKGFSEFFFNNRPDMLVLLGDRTEMLGVAAAAMNANIPIAHLHGGEVTEGAVDDCVRHALTKMSYIHFTGTDIYRNRVIQMGEHPARVFNVGALSAENILNVPLMSELEIKSDIDIPNDMNYAVLTLHPETVESLSPKKAAGILCECMDKERNTFFVITASNSDVGGDIINNIFINYANQNPNAVFCHSLGMKKYLSAVKHAEYVIGNSSSGIIEAPILGVPTVNIGDRQRGRIMAQTIINTAFDIPSICDAISKTAEIDRIPSNIYGDGNTSEKVVSIIKKVLQDKIDLKKGFYDLDPVRR